MMNRAGIGSLMRAGPAPRCRTLSEGRSSFPARSQRHCNPGCRESGRPTVGNLHSAEDFPRLGYSLSKRQ